MERIMLEGKYTLFSELEYTARYGGEENIGKCDHIDIMDNMK